MKQNLDFDLYMGMALDLARDAAEAGEVPVGAVVVRLDDGAVLGKGRNRREERKAADGHAEMEAISQACSGLNDWRLDQAALFVTLEPCPMCAGAIINSRIPLVVYGAKDPVMGCCGSVIDLFFEAFGHRPAIYGGVREQECSSLLNSFFKEVRSCTSTNMKIRNWF